MELVMEAMDLEPLTYIEKEGKKCLVFKPDKKRKKDKVKVKSKTVVKIKKKRRVI